MPMRLPSDPREAIVYLRGYYDAKADYEVQLEEKTGKWIRNFDGNEWYWFCSNCKEEWYEEDLLIGGNNFPNRCPNCGARMVD